MYLYFVVIGFFLVIFGSFIGEYEMIDVWKEVWEYLEKDIGFFKKLVSIKGFSVKY